MHASVKRALKDAWSASDAPKFDTFAPFLPADFNRDKHLGPSERIFCSGTNVN
jgi:hypothetical protein